MREYTTSNGGCLRFQFHFPASDPGSFEGYRALLGWMFDVALPAGGEAAPFEAEAESMVFDGLVVSSARSTPVELTRAPSLIAKAGSDDIAVIAYTEGEIRIKVANAHRDVLPGEILVIDLAKPIEIAAHNSHNNALLISRQRLAPWSEVLMDVHGSVIGHGAMQRMLANHVRSLVHDGPLIRESEAPAVAETTLQFVGACLQQLRPRANDAGSGAVSLSRVREAIERRLADPDLGPASLMQEFGLSRPTLYRLFEPLGGVIRYITERRLQTAFRIITDPTSPAPRVSRLAYDYGFSSASAFGRAFREMFGLTPTEARKLAWRSVPDDKAPSGLSPDLQRFMRFD